ncbi:MAG: hypothetical protein LUG83_08255 [Lachnospiraceae bacterium]|nr:hypothetical protein [Lachnospiraceae bacterium]
MITFAYALGPLLFFCLLNLWTVYLGKKSFGTSLPVTLMVSALLLYISQLVFKTFNVGMGICMLLAAGAAVLLIVRGKDHEFTGRFISNGFYAFLAVYFLFLLVDYNRYFNSWDELSHWGKMVKEMLRLDSFYSEAASDLLVHKDYPPFVSIFQMLWCRLILGYSESGVTMALHVFEFAVLVPPIADKLCNIKSIGKIKALLYNLILTVIFALIILNFEYSGFNSIYTDLFMPVLYAYIISVIMDKEQCCSVFGLFSIVLGQVCLIISKQMSITFVLLIWLFFTLSIILYANIGKAGHDFKKILPPLCKSALVLIAPIIVFISWKLYIVKLGILGQFDLSNISISALWEIIKGGGTYAQHNVYKDYIDALFTLTQSSGTFNMPYAAAVIVAICILFCMYYFYKNVMSKKEVLIYLTLFVIGSICYALTMFILYLFCFSEYEMSQLASYQRYMSSYVVSEYIILFLLFLALLNRRKIVFMNFRRLILSLGICLLIFDASKLSCLSPQAFKGMPLSEYSSRAEKIQSLSDDGDSIFLISTNNNLYMYFLNYYLDDRSMDARYLYSDVARQSTDDAEYWNVVTDCIKENDYVYIYDITDNVNLLLAQYSENGILCSDSLYEVLTDDDSLILKYVG